MSPFAVKAIQLLLSLSILIVLHELGHFIPAKIFKVRVEKFFLFFDVKFALWRKKIGETVYGIGWLPLGGYVKLSGMIDESMDKEQMAGPPQPWEFRSKPAWQRLIIMLGGVTVNIIVGFVIYIAIIGSYGRDIVTPEDMPRGFSVDQEFQEMGFRDGDLILQVNGKDFPNMTDINKYLFLRDVQTITVRHADQSQETISIPDDIGTFMFENDVQRPFDRLRNPIIDTVLSDFPAASAGMKKGDSIISFNGQPIEHWHEFKRKLSENANLDNDIVYYRNGRIDSLTVKPNEDGLIGANNYGKELVGKVTHVNYTFGESITEGVSYGYNILKDYVKQFKYVFTKKGATQVGGFGAIGNLFPATWNWLNFWQTTALISIILAFMNVLPIPALDGGHVMFLLYEMVTGRKPHDKFMEYAQMIGFFLLIALVLFANGNDIYRAIFDK
ncbi:RIP metalloprotease RseP [Aureitalea marina]|uniref:Zinc metalloprotease n=1 Tax=Aureitalea marina TaxID=930804 RepID=A0A2S7KSI2_9FLAO|nr:RIP metalloprotease RseP [Aureitalea marina]PQB05567.1 RIP metalloprotease RseP [Aureitalea marina]